MSTFEFVAFLVSENTELLNCIFSILLISSILSSRFFSMLADVLGSAACCGDGLASQAANLKRYSVPVQAI
jgi:hypothetical protein